MFETGDQFGCETGHVSFPKCLSEISGGNSLIAGEYADTDGEAAVFTAEFLGAVFRSDPFFLHDFDPHVGVL